MALDGFFVPNKMKTLKFAILCVITLSVVNIFAIRHFIKSLNANREVMQSEGLKIRSGNFTLHGKPFRIMSGSMHYFRIPNDEWSDRLVKLKAMGLNTVDIYIPWNLHEPTPGKYNFHDAAIEITAFLTLVSSHELYAIVRPGPYICSEWDLGGLPSWLLRDKAMKLRSMYPGFIKPVERYFSKLLPLLRPFQFSHGGPVIAFQIENEYGVYGNDTRYMSHLKHLFTSHHLNELLFVCDNEDGLGKYKLDGVLQTVNFMSKGAKRVIKRLLELQPDKPVFVTEFWDGWFDHWGEKHHKVDVTEIMETLKYIIHVGGSFNFYMWHGGTNFGFMNGANANDDGSHYQSTITSYDYDAPLSESGNSGEKYEKLQQYIGKSFPSVILSDISPFNSGFANYGKIQLEKYISLESIVSQVKPVKQKFPVAMEMLQMHKDYGQAYGYIIYEIKIKHGGKVLKISQAKDYVIVVLNNIIVYKGSLNGDPTIVVDLDGHLKRDGDNVLQILVENCGRVNYGMDINNQRKGILGSVLLDSSKLMNWKIYPLQFERDWVKKISRDERGWKDAVFKQRTDEIKLPSLYKGNLNVPHLPRKTFISFPRWYKGVVFLNGFNLGRYWNIGPQKTLFVPGQYLQTGDNQLLVFDLHGGPLKNKDDKYPLVLSTNERDIGQKESQSFLI